MTSTTPTVIAAAIRSHESGKVFSVSKPGRHCNVIWLMDAKGPKFSQRDEQGFVLSDGRFVTRKAAYQVAVVAGQIKDGDGVAPQHGLFSEDLW